MDESKYIYEVWWHISVNEVFQKKSVLCATIEAAKKARVNIAKQADIIGASITEITITKVEVLQ